MTDERLPQHISADPLTHDFYAEAQNGKKRDYIFSVHQMRKCSHRRMVLTMMGGSNYRCLDCNWTFDVVTANAQPMHHLTVKAMYQLLHFAKEFGVAALQEVLRQPHGQDDGSPHKGVIPDGMTITDALRALDSIDVTQPDGGAEQLQAIVDTVWPNEREFERRIKALEGSDAPGKQEYAAYLRERLEERRALTAGNGNKALNPKAQRKPKVSLMPTPGAE